jgi:flagellar basal-body rod protein FlgF
MDSLLTAAAAGMRSRMEALDLAANKIANTGTTGFKLDRESYNLYVAPEAFDPESPAPSTLPVVERNWTDFSQGSLTSTGNLLDVAISGPGFFAVNGPGSTLYTRDGSFRLSQTGVIVTAEGYPLRGATGATIQLQPNLPFEIAPDGTVKQAGVDVGKVEVTDFDQPRALAKFGRNYFQSDGAATPKPAANSQVEQGKVEASNVAAPESAVRLINLMRQFEMLQKAITMDGDMGRQAIEQVARVS